MKRLLLAALAAALSGSCGGGDASDTADGGPLDPRCEMQISRRAPTNPEVGAVIDVDGAIFKQDVVGIESYLFSVDGPPGSDPSPRMRAAGDDALIEFDADVVGTYRVELRGDVAGLSCTDDVESFYVALPGAPTTSFRFRFSPGLGQEAPPQDKVFEIPGGGDFPLGVIGLDKGLLTTGMVSDTGPLAAYLRFTRTFDGAATEVFADESGAISTRLLAGAYEVLVVPELATAVPAIFSDLNITGAGALTLSLGAGESITGTVRDGGGQPVADAQVSLRIDGVPSTVATTDANGNFAVLAHAGGATALTVTPPAASGLPRLELAASAGLVASATAPLAIDYAAPLTARTIDVVLRAADGATPMPGASATLIARPISGAGAVTPQGGSSLVAAGHHRATAGADAAGRIALHLPDAIYDVIVRSPAGVASLLVADLEAGQGTPASLVAAAPARVTGRVLDAAAGVEGARVTARPVAMLASEPMAGAVAVAGADGSFALDVVAGGDYELVIEPPARLAREIVTGVQAPAATEEVAIGDRVLAPAIVVRGQVAIPGNSQPGGVTVQVFCATCTGTAAFTPVAEAVADNDGRFAVSIPDPGGGS